MGSLQSASGGADSSAVICLIAIGIAMVVSEHDSDTRNRLGLRDISRSSSRDLSKNSYSDPSVRDCCRSAHLCLSINNTFKCNNTRSGLQDRSVVGANFHEFDVEPLVQKYEEFAEAVIGRELSWKSDDIARQNIQARVRAPGVWLIANLYNAMLVATSNRSEAAVGYATMDGDTAGGFSPIAGIDKAFLRDWHAMD